VSLPIAKDLATGRCQIKTRPQSGGADHENVTQSFLDVMPRQSQAGEVWARFAVGCDKHVTNRCGVTNTRTEFAGPNPASLNFDGCAGMVCGDFSGVRMRKNRARRNR